jgi:hypothetical protein
VALCLAAALVAAPASALVIDHNLGFAATDQSPFQTGGVFNQSYAEFFGPAWTNKTLSVGDIPPIGPLYVTPSLTTSGRFGAEFGYALSGGKLNLVYPVSSQVSLPDSVHEDSVFTVSSNVGLNPAGFSYARETLDANPLLSTRWVPLASAGFRGVVPSLSTTFPSTTAYLDLVAEFSGQANMTATYPKITIFPPSISSKTEDVLGLKLPGFAERLSVFELSRSGITTAIPGASIPFGEAIPIIPPNVLTTTFNYPDLKTTGALDGTMLRSGGEQTVANLNMNVLQLLGLGFPPLKALEGSIPLGIGSFEYKLLEVDAGLDLNLRQDFLFTGTPEAFLYLDTPVSIVDGSNWSAPTRLVPLPASGNLRLALPGGRGANPVDAQLSYVLLNEVRNDTKLELEGYLEASALSAKLDLDLGIVDINESVGPVIGPVGPRGTLATFDIFSDTFPVNVTPIWTPPFQLDVTPAVYSPRARFLTTTPGGTPVYLIQEVAGEGFTRGAALAFGQVYNDVGGGTLFLSNEDVIIDTDGDNIGDVNYGRLFCVTCVDLNPNPALASSQFPIEGGGESFINDLLMDLISPPSGPDCESCVEDFLAAHQSVLDVSIGDPEILLNRLPEIFPINELPTLVPVPGTIWLVWLGLGILAAARIRAGAGQAGTGVRLD